VRAGGVGCVIPVKPLGAALGRLGEVLGVEGRRALQSAMLTDLLRAVAEARGVGETVVVTADPEAARLARAEGAATLPDHRPPRGMNAAVRLGTRALASDGAEAALILVADLPLARAGDLEALLAAAPPGRGVALAASRDGTGTNALLVRPPEALDPRLGPGSLARHLAGAERRRLPVSVLERPALGLDIDTPEDLAAYVAVAPRGATREACARLGLGERLAVGAPR
jgi:2-phospho-L-lactate/phosphoenolpyruvate guanylyltransferase